MKLSTNLLLGADPELFLKNPNNGSFISAHEYVKGTKEVPYPVDKGAIQLDGTAAEFNIWPALTADAWVGNIKAVMGSLATQVAGSGYVLSASPVADFEPDYFESIPSSAKKLGCDPDFDAWELCPNETPDVTRTFRTGAGHIHLGWGTGFNTNDPEHFELCAEVARQLDYYLGIHSLLWDPESRRRELYGRAGAFRPKSYGVEYRTLSNAWLRTEMLQRWVYHTAKAAIEDFDAGLKYQDFHHDLARDIINGGDVDWWKQTGAPEFDKVPLPPGFKKVA